MFSFDVKIVYPSIDVELTINFIIDKTDKSPEKFFEHVENKIFPPKPN